MGDPHESVDRGWPLVLVADDDAVVRMLVALQLRKAGFASLVVEDGISALLAASRNTFVCALLDVDMPVLDGVSAAWALAARSPELPVVLMSGLPEDEVAVRLGPLAVSGQLAKPFSGEQLAAMMARVTSQVPVALVRALPRL